MKKVFSANGFSLAELMIAVVILGVLASISVPLYLKSVEHGRQAEAYQTLGAIRSAVIRYYNINFNWPTDIAATDFSGTGNFGQTIPELEYLSKYFGYRLKSDNECIVAQRLNKENPGYSNYSILLYFNGVLQKDISAP